MISHLIEESLAEANPRFRHLIVQRALVQPELDSPVMVQSTRVQSAPTRFVLVAAKPAPIPTVFSLLDLGFQSANMAVLNLAAVVPVICAILSHETTHHRLQIDPTFDKPYDG